jgi:hypothetical protein
MATTKSKSPASKGRGRKPAAEKAPPKAARAGKAKAEKVKKPKASKATKTKAAAPAESPQSQITVKRLPWRPSEYREEYCEAVIEWGRDGKSKTWMAAQIGVSRDTIYEWCKRYPAFADALSYAKTCEQAKWEDLGQIGVNSIGFSATAWSRSMAARFPDDWRESSKHEVTGMDGAPLMPENVSSRDMARAVLDILRAAKVESAPE